MSDQLDTCGYAGTAVTMSCLSILSFYLTPCSLVDKGHKRFRSEMRQTANTSFPAAKVCQLKTVVTTARVTSSIPGSWRHTAWQFGGLQVNGTLEQGSDETKRANRKGLMYPKGKRRKASQPQSGIDSGDAMWDWTTLPKCHEG